MALAKKRKVDSNANVRCTYIIEIDDWHLPYYFALNDRELFGPQICYESVSIEISGRLLCPKKVKGRELKVGLHGERDLAKTVLTPRGEAKMPIGIGNLWCRKDQSELMVWLPFDVLSLIVSSLAAGKIRFIDLDGNPLHYGEATITSIRFAKEIDPADLA